MVWAFPLVDDASRCDSCEAGHLDTKDVGVSWSSAAISHCFAINVRCWRFYGLVVFQRHLCLCLTWLLLHHQNSLNRSQNIKTTLFVFYLPALEPHLFRNAKAQFVFMVLNILYIPPFNTSNKCNIKRHYPRKESITFFYIYNTKNCIRKSSCIHLTLWMFYLCYEDVWASFSFWDKRLKELPWPLLDIDTRGFKRFRVCA